MSPKQNMKKISLLIGTLGGAVAGYLFSNDKLRKELAKAKDAEEAAKLLGKHLQHDGKKVAGQVREFVRSDEVQKNLSKAKQYAKSKVTETKNEFGKMVDKGKQKATVAARQGAVKAKQQVKKGTKSAKKVVKSAAKNAKRKANSMKTKTRTLS